jgi:cytochrome d ubiquinol oxidase subunit I
MVAGEPVSTLLLISALGIYIHAVFLSMSLGLPWIIMALLYKWWRTQDEDYYRAARTVTGVLGLNFALGAITGTLVEFGLVQAWPGSIFVIATFGFTPLALELIAFVGEIVFLILFIVTLRKASAPFSMCIMALYIVMAVFSGAVITSVNSWLNVPWGTDGLASSLYPFLPEYGPASANIQALVRLKVELVRALLLSGTSSQVLQDPAFAQKIGLTLSDPFVAFSSQYALASALHNVNAGMIIGMSFGLVGYAYRFYRTGDKKYVKIIRAFLPVLLILLILQPTVFGDLMGKAVAANQPTKFALMEHALTTTQNPLVAFLAYGDPNHLIYGFDRFRTACMTMKGDTLGNLVSHVVPNLNVGPASSTDLSDICLTDLANAEGWITAINAAYYAKITAGVIALVALLGLACFLFEVKGLSKLANRILAPLGHRKGVLLLSLIAMSGSVLAAAFGWFVREAGRKPWTVYGFLYPDELITPVAINPIVFALFVLVFVVVALVGLFGIFVVATKGLKFIELLKKGAGVE